MTLHSKINTTQATALVNKAFVFGSFKALLLIVLLVITPLSGCKRFVEDYSISPVEPLSTRPDLMLPVVQVSLFNNYTGNLARISSIFMQQQAGVTGSYALHDGYILRENDIDEDWKNLYSTLKNLDVMIRQAQSERKLHYVGIGKVMTAMALGLATDCWGDVPYSEAFQGRDLPNPKFDSQQEIYLTIETLLNDGIANLSIPSGELPNVPKVSPGSDDLIFNGDLNNWLIAAHSLKARYALRLSKVNGEQAYSKALQSITAARELGASSSSDMIATFGNSSSQANFWSQFLESSFGSSMVMGKYIVDTMLFSGDPRLPFIYADAPANEALADTFIGYPAGGGDGVSTNFQDYSLLGLTNFSDYTSPAQLLTYKELRFIEAEALLQIGNTAGAAEAYNAALAAAMEFPDIDPDGVSAYLESYSRTADDITLEDILFQKYLALFTQIEAWSDYRRTGLPNLQPANGRSLDDFPRSLPTAQSERQLNNKAPRRVGLTERVWWDRQ
jgi:hypothetical protein